LAWRSSVSLPVSRSPGPPAMANSIRWRLSR